MINLKHVLIILLLLLTAQDKGKAVKWALTKNCSLKVNGSTNINKFSCVIPDYTNPDTLAMYSHKGAEEVKISGQMVLPIKSFDCHNVIMTKDLRKTLKAEEFPKLTVTFISLSKYPDPSRGESIISGSVNISIAGITKRFDVAYRCTADGLKNITLIGTKTINFSDFNIIPPRKIGGMIKTNNQLDVEFTLKANILN
ncbi:YceI family protein [Pedobacter sp. PWIIR3]